MDSLKLDSDFALNSMHNGFAVNVDVAIQGFKPFSKYFRSNFFQIILFKSGKTDLSLNLTDYQITKDELIVCAPFDLKKVNSFNNSKHSTILFTSDFLEKAGLSKTAPEIMPFFTNQYSPHWKLNAETATKINIITPITYGGILILFILCMTYGCKKNEIKNQRTFYYAVHESDTAILSIGTHKDRFFGQYEIYNGNRSVKDSGNVEGTISGDTLRGKFRYRAFGGTVNIKPIIFLKEQKN